MTNTTSKAVPTAKAYRRAFLFDSSICACRACLGARLLHMQLARAMRNFSRYFKSFPSTTHHHQFVDVIQFHSGFNLLMPICTSFCFSCYLQTSNFVQEKSKHPIVIQKCDYICSSLFIRFMQEWYMAKQKDQGEKDKINQRQSSSIINNHHLRYHALKATPQEMSRSN